MPAHSFTKRETLFSVTAVAERVGERLGDVAKKKVDTHKHTKLTEALKSL